jgi:hydrogenase maturation protein HypF
MDGVAERARISVKGVVQGVGFRPFVYALASSLGLRGFVENTADGVLIEAEGERLPDFLSRLRPEAPPLSRITGLAVTNLPHHGYGDFSIRASSDSPDAYTLVSPDAATCPDCLRELLDPSDRRYRYPFINCTNCGPRYSITLRVPYDRPNTTMAVFAMCPKCEQEYHDPASRRFHAQPNACPVCGPKVTFRIHGPGFSVTESDPVRAAIEVMQQGGIVAVKGLGGFHLACDAANNRAVGALRERKRKSNKPFAVMARSIADIREFCEIGPDEEALLASVKRPVVLLRKRPSGRQLSTLVSPNNRDIGCMLPYTPLHHLLFQAEPGKGFLALVMTSGNLSEEPIIHRNDEAMKRLSSIVDAFLLHDRDIFMRVDDSVVRATNRRWTSASAFMFLRRSRGYAPDPIELTDAGPEVLGCGADLKNTFTLTKGAVAVPSQHIGDMENYETLRFYEECLENLKQVYRVEPVALAHDLHPGYLSTRWAMEKGSAGREQGKRLRTFAIQHHYAHIGSVMAEHGLTCPVIGVAFDGTGYGTDGNLWGGEFLIAGIEGFERVGQLRYVPLPGGEAAIREPWRTAVSALLQAAPDTVEENLEAAGFFERYGRRAVEQVLQVAGMRDLSPLSSGAGRIFDAVSALLGVCDRNTFEGEAAMNLESLVREDIDEDYAVVFERENGYTTIDFSRAILQILTALRRREDRSIIATRFHNTVVNSILRMTTDLSTDRAIREVALSGGAFQNRFLLSKTSGALAASGIRVYTNREMPPNDACISLGQAYLVRERLKRGLAA